MEGILRNFFLENITRKIFAILTAIIIWYVVNHSITMTKTFTDIPVCIVNLPENMTMHGLMPGDIWDRKLTLTITGTKDVLEHLRSQDIEVIIDAAGKGNEWVATIGKKNLVSLNPDIDFTHAIDSVTHEQIFMKLSRLVTEKIPIHIVMPEGEAPDGYQFLDVWPNMLMQTVSGPEEDVQALQKTGLELKLNLSDITKEMLDSIKSTVAGKSNEVSFPIPDAWKKVVIPFLNNSKEQINSPEAKQLRIDFLRNEWLPLPEKIPVIAFYPLVSNGEINPKSYPIVTSDDVVDCNGVMATVAPFFVKDVGVQFLNVVKERLAIVVLVSSEEANHLQWALQCMDPADLEDRYIALLLDKSAGLSKQEAPLRERFQKYLQMLRLYTKHKEPAVITARLEKGKIAIVVSG